MLQYWPGCRSDEIIWCVGPAVRRIEATTD